MFVEIFTNIINPMLYYKQFLILTLFWASEGRGELAILPLIVHFLCNYLKTALRVCFKLPYSAQNFISHIVQKFLVF